MWRCSPLAWAQGGGQLRGGGEDVAGSEGLWGSEVVGGGLGIPLWLAAWGLLLGRLGVCRGDSWIGGAGCGAEVPSDLLYLAFPAGCETDMVFPVGVGRMVRFGAGFLEFAVRHEWPGLTRPRLWREKVLHGAQALLGVIPAASKILGPNLEVATSMAISYALRTAPRARRSVGGLEPGDAFRDAVLFAYL